MMHHSWRVKFISIALSAALMMQLPIAAFADENDAVIPEEAVELVETGETTVIPEVTDETVVDDPTDTEDVTSGDTTETEQPEEEPTDTSDEPAEEEGTEEKEETVEDETIEGEETEEEENTEEASAEDEIVDEETSDAKLAKLLTEADEEEDIELLADEIDGTETDATTTTYKYAVQIYDIGVDDVWNDTDNDGEVDTDEISKGGLTFGPAIGADYTSTSKSHTVDESGYISDTDAGEDSAGNKYRCVHNDDWATIIANNKTDPYIYEKCLSNGCTKTIELNLTAENSEADSTSSTKVFIKSDTAVTLSGDGPGIMVDIIQKEARKYADKGDASLTWANSQLRAVLNGAQTETGSTYGGRDADDNAEYTEDNSVLSAFPTDLQNAIGKKAVTYATDVTNVSSAVQTCYDRLWLCSVKELAFTSSSTVFTNEGTAYAWPTAVMKSKSAIQSWEVFVNNNGTVGSSEAYWWTRTRTKGDATKSARVNNGGKNAGGKDVTLSDDDDRNIGFGPGFVLARSTEEPDPEPEEKEGYRYAVQIYGIGVDEVLSDDETEAADNKTYLGGLTFGPAIGSDYTNDYKSHEPTGSTDGKYSTTGSGNEHRCIHNDTWDQIIEWNEKDPYVYEQCLAEGCTKAVELTLTTGDNGNAADGTSTEKVFNTSATKYSGDGVGALYNEMQKTSRHWGNYYEKGTEERETYLSTLNWSDSVIRAALNGYAETNTYGTTYSETNSILSAFPQELQSTIGKKAVKYATAWNITDDYGTSYDQLWLFSTKEIYGRISSGYFYEMEGDRYARTASLTTSDKTAVYIAKDTTQWTWLRSSYKYDKGRAALAFNGNEAKMGHSWVDGESLSNEGYGISPGFTLYRETVVPEEETTGYRYAVQLYGIGVDDVWNDTDGDGEVHADEITKGGLTFGPAIGANYTSTSIEATKGYHSHEASGTTTSRTLADGSVIKGGHAKRCIHDDSWETIITWNDIDPFVYEDCITNQCTKSVPLTMTSSNSAASTDTTKVFLTSAARYDGDGPGALYNEIQRQSRNWADSGSSGLNWSNSRIRAMLNGYTYTSDYFKTNNYNDTNSVLSAFPSELKEAIARKAVVYTPVYNNKNDTAIVYDKLWLLSSAELYGDVTGSYSNWNYPNEGTQYERTKVLDITQPGLAYAYSSKEGGLPWSWTRTLVYNAQDRVTNAFNKNSNRNNRPLDQSYANGNYGVSPGFVLSRDVAEHSAVVQIPVTGGEGRDTIYTMATALAILALAGLHLRRRRTYM